MVKEKPKASPKKGRKAKTPSAVSVPQQDTVERQVMIAEAAYFIAEQRGFTAGDELGDWLQAEREIQTSLQQP
ncbi:MAG TPA: DUF2934 domain-containing protein [Chromatiales bacterium]|nr:DUF2934 domain-containing protein [Chromatiales bacterium]HEX21852.1 DUF2934 domain-containing protein [Chromatiales bacterium]